MGDRSHSKKDRCVSQPFHKPFGSSPFAVCLLPTEALAKVGLPFASLRNPSDSVHVFT
jgi:hypothetical protein